MSSEKKNSVELTAREQTFRKWMLVSAILYGGGGAVFAFGPLAMSAWLSSQAGGYLAPGTAINPLVVATTSSFFWNALAVSMMATITVCALRAWKDPVGSAGYALAVVVAKLTSSGMAVFTLLISPGELTHTIPAIIAVTDLPLGLVTLWMYTLAKRSRAVANSSEAVS